MLDENAIGKPSKAAYSSRQTPYPRHLVPVAISSHPVSRSSPYKISSTWRVLSGIILLEVNVSEAVYTGRSSRSERQNIQYGYINYPTKPLARSQFNGELPIPAERYTPILLSNPLIVSNKTKRLMSCSFITLQYSF